MGKVMIYECKIIGITPLWISMLMVGTFLILCATGGNNLNWGYLGFEVVFPFYVAVVIGEWCKTRTDPMFDVIAAHGKSIFGWIIRRFFLLFGVSCIFSFVGMTGVSVMKKENSLFELMLIFFPVAFFLSSMCVFISLIVNAPHISAMSVGIFWLFSIMTISLLRFKAVQYFYLFIRYAGVNSPLWIANKAILFLSGLMLWMGIFFVCKKRSCCKLCL